MGRLSKWRAQLTVNQPSMTVMVRLHLSPPGECRIRQMGTILQRKGRGRIWGRELESSGKKKKQTVKKQKGHFKKHWDEDLWD